MHKIYLIKNPEDPIYVYKLQYTIYIVRLICKSQRHALVDGDGGGKQSIEKHNIYLYKSETYREIDSPINIHKYIYIYMCVYNVYYTHTHASHT